MFSDVDNAGWAPWASYCLIKDSWQRPGACLLGKPPHLLCSAQVNQAHSGANAILVQQEHCLRKHKKILCDLSECTLTLV